MSIALVLAGVVLLMAAIRNTQGQLGTLISGDLGGGVIAWIAVIAAVGAAGYAPSLRTPSRALLALAVLGYAAQHGQTVISNAESVVTGALPAAATGPVVAPITQPVPVQVTGGSASAGAGASGAAGAAGSAVSAIGSLGSLFGGL